MNYQRLLIDHLDLIDQIVRTIGRRRHFSAVELEDFAGFVRLRLIEDDYAILRKFKGRSSLHGYLTTVILNLATDFFHTRGERWRVPASAMHLGPVATLLARLIIRDGHTLEEAMEIVRTNHGVGLTYGELRAMWAKVREKPRPIEVPEEAAAEVPSAETSDVRVQEHARRHDIERLEACLREAFASLAAQDRVMIALRFDHGLPAVEVAKVMQSSAPTVHRRLDRSLKQLGEALTRAGFDSAAINSVVGHSTTLFSPLLRAEVERFLKSGRLLKRDG